MDTRAADDPRVDPVGIPPADIYRTVGWPYFRGFPLVSLAWLKQNRRAEVEVPYDDDLHGGEAGTEGSGGNQEIVAVYRQDGTVRAVARHDVVDGRSRGGAEYPGA